MITGAQIRGARAMLGWTAAQLAEKSGISYATIQRAESIDGISSMRATNLYAIQRALEDGGVIFLGAGDNRPGGDGVRLKLRS
jgi:transcriptional regulator with XRE-family HTH domain